jgi:hypothetical protein
MNTASDENLTGSPDMSIRRRSKREIDKKTDEALLEKMRYQLWLNSSIGKKYRKDVNKKTANETLERSAPILAAMKNYVGKCSEATQECSVGPMRDFLGVIKDDAMTASDIAIEGTTDFLSSTRSSLKQTTSSIYDFGLKASWGLYEFINNAMGNQTMDAALLIHEMHIYNAIQDYYDNNKDKFDNDNRTGVILDSILAEGDDDKTLNTIMAHIEAATTLFHFNVMGKSAVHDMSIRSTEPINPHIGQGAASIFFHRDNENRILEEVKKGAKENASRFTRENPDFAREVKYFALMVVANVDNTKNSNEHGVLEAYKYYGAPKEMPIFVQDLIQELTTSVNEAVASVETPWKHYRDNAISTGASIDNYKEKISVINKYTQEQIEEIQRTVEGMLSKRSQMLQLGFDIFDERDSDAITEITTNVRAQLNGLSENLPNRGFALENEIDQAISERKAKLDAEAEMQVVPVTDTQKRRIKAKLNPLPSDTQREPAIKRTTSELSEDSQDSTAHKNKRGKLTSVDEEDEEGMFGGRKHSVKKRRPRRVAKKTRKGKKGKAGKMSRKTRKNTRGRKIKKIKKAQKTRKLKKHTGRNKARK